MSAVTGCDLGGWQACVVLYGDSRVLLTCCYTPTLHFPLPSAVVAGWDNQPSEDGWASVVLP